MTAATELHSAGAPEGSAGGVSIAFPGVLLCFLLSGFAALLYETVWMRQFSVVFGTSELAVATVLAVYMAGLSIGAALSGRLLPRVKRPVLVYGVLELAIALAALSVPLMLKAARALQTSVIGGRPELMDSGGITHTLFYLVASFFILLIPTALMGATLPLLTRHAVRDDKQVGSRGGLLYATNTGGAVLGTIVAAFVLIPRIGLAQTMWVGVAINGLVFLVAALLARRTSASPPEAPVAARERSATVDDTVLRGRREWLLLLIAASGAVSFTYEVLWTRLLGHVLGGSLFAFATMLASFLTGITLGSAAASRLARTRRGSAVGFALCQLGTAALSIAIYLTMDRLPDLARSIGVGGDAGFWNSAIFSCLILLPATLCIGATFPFMLRALARDEHEAGPLAARVYAWNTVGAISGALLAGFLIIPALGFAGTARLAVAVNLLIALATVLCLRDARRLMGVSASAAIAGILLFQPSPPSKLLRSSYYTGLGSSGREVFSRVGRSATVLMLERDGYFDLRTNGLPEAKISISGVPPFGTTAPWWLSVLPVIARPDANSMLVIGFGGGVAIEGVPPSIEAIDSIEIESAVMEANRLAADARRHDPLRDPRLRNWLNDARGALALTEKRWDIVVSQPSHPWTAGASHLYTREFASLVSSHLNERGVFVQWASSAFLDPELLKTVGATLLDVFKHVRLYHPYPEMLIFLASDAPLDPERELARTGEPLASSAAHYAQLGINGLEDIVSALLLDEEGLRELCTGTQISTDDNNLLAVRSPGAMGGSLDEEALFELLSPHDRLLQEDSDLRRELEPHIDRSLIARRLMLVGLVPRAKAIADTAPDGVERLLANATCYLLVGDVATSNQLVANALTGSDDMRARYRLIEPHLALLARGDAPPAIKRAATGLTGSASAVVAGWQRAAKQDWKGVAGLDGALSRSRPRDPWFVEASRLRATALVNSTAPTLKERRRDARRALRILDKALVIRQDPHSLLVRASAAGAARDEPTLIETVNALLRFLENENLPASLGDEIRRTAQKSLRSFPPEGSNTRADAVRARFAGSS